MECWESFSSSLHETIKTVRQKIDKKKPSCKSSTRHLRCVPIKQSGMLSRINLLTWNVNGKEPPLRIGILLGLSSELPDIFAIGLQEVADASAWLNAFDVTLNTENFVRLKQRQLQGLLTVVYVNKSRLPFVTSVESEVTRTGFGGIWGNKGGVSVRLDYMGMNMIVVNCHLQAHMQNVQGRLDDIDYILDYQKFKDKDVENIMDHDYVFWIGDLNFRIEGVTYERCLRLVQLHSYNTLLASDQLTSVKEEGLAFVDFKEGKINFAPTYKFDNGTDTYDTSNKRRIPAYCDRILYFHHNTSYGSVELGANIVNYNTLNKFKASDHKPVAATIDFTVFDRPPQNPVLFQAQSAWKKNKDCEVIFYVHESFSITSSDWIGIFKVNFKDFSNYESYVWAPTKSRWEKPIRNHWVMRTHFTSSSLQSLPSGLYYLCYLTKNYSLCGVSETFRINH